MKFNTVDVDNLIEKLGQDFVKSELYNSVIERSNERIKQKVNPTVEKDFEICEKKYVYTGSLINFRAHGQGKLTQIVFGLKNYQDQKSYRNFNHIKMSIKIPNQLKQFIPKDDLVLPTDNFNIQQHDKQQNQNIITYHGEFKYGLPFGRGQFEFGCPIIVDRIKYRFLKSTFVNGIPTEFVELFEEYENQNKQMACQYYKDIQKVFGEIPDVSGIEEGKQEGLTSQAQRLDKIDWAKLSIVQQIQPHSLIVLFKVKNINLMGQFKEYVDNNESKGEQSEHNKAIFKQNKKLNIVDPYYFECDNNHGKLYLRDLEFQNNLEGELMIQKQVNSKIKNQEKVQDFQNNSPIKSKQSTKKDLTKTLQSSFNENQVADQIMPKSIKRVQTSSNINSSKQKIKQKSPDKKLHVENILLGTRSVKNVNTMELIKHDNDLKKLIKNQNKKNQELKRSKLSKSQNLKKGDDNIKKQLMNNQLGMFKNALL